MPILTWEGPADQMPNFCPEGCGGVTEDPYGGPCKACWRAVDDRERAEREADGDMAEFFDQWPELPAVTSELPASIGEAAISEEKS